DHSRAYAPRGGATCEHHRVTAMPGHQRSQVGLEKRGSHALVDDDVTHMVDFQAIVEFGSTRTHFDVLQRIWCIGTSTPNATVLARFHVRHVSPYDRQLLRTKCVCQLIHIL